MKNLKSQISNLKNINQKSETNQYILLENLNRTIVHSTDTLEYILNKNSQATILVVLRPGEQSVTVRLVGSGAHVRIIGIGNLSGNTQAVLHTLQHHEEKETTSNLLVKTVLSDQASFSYDGAIRVEKAAQKTDAYQRNENLLLSDYAHAQSKPSLEILANDVRCTHGATISTVDPEQLFFLESRGIDQKQGTALIIQGFLDSVFSGVADTMAIQKIKEEVWQTLSKPQV